MTPRQRRVVVVLGAPGCGKTNGITRPLVQRYLAAGGQVKILDPAGEFDELGESIACWPGRGATDEWIDNLTAYGEGPRAGGWGPGLLVLDDADRFLSSGNTRSWQDLWMANRHLGLDVVVTAHRPQGVPKELLGSCHELWLCMQDEPHALEYLSAIPALAPIFETGEHPLPTEPGRALKVLVRERQLFEVELFRTAKPAAELEQLPAGDVDVEAQSPESADDAD